MSGIPVVAIVSAVCMFNSAPFARAQTNRVAYEGTNEPARLSPQPSVETSRTVGAVSAPESLFAMETSHTGAGSFTVGTPHTGESLPAVELSSPMGTSRAGETPAVAEWSDAAWAEIIRSALGRRAGDPRFDPRADLNGDGVVNALDLAIFRLRGAPDDRTAPSSGATAPPGGSGNAVAPGERIIVEGLTTIALPGQTVSVLFLIRDNATPLLSYTVEASAMPQPGAAGTVTANATKTSFFDSRNLIAACPPTVCPVGAARDPMFSFIADNGFGGVTVSTITQDGSTVRATDGVNDVLTQVVFDVPPNALGDFTVQLGSATVLVDGNLSVVPFTFTPGVIRVVDPAVIPTTSSWGLAILVVAMLSAGSALWLRVHRKL